MRRIVCVGGLVALLAGGSSAVRADGVYFVKQGDSLYRIAKVFHLDADKLAEFNGLTSRKLQPGDRLRIPEKAVEETFHVPAEGSPAPARTPEPAVTSATVATASTTVSTAASAAPEPRKVVCRTDVVTHTVEQGDTLLALARRYHTTVEELLSLNGLRRSSRLALGRRLTVQSTAPKTHVVRRGDTLSKIAARYDVSLETLRRLNDVSGDRLALGQKILLESCAEFALVGVSPDALATAAADHVALAESEAEAALKARDDLEGGPNHAVPAASQENPGLSEQLIAFARAMLDIPYRFGGTSMRGIDCSGFVQRVFSMLGVPIPRTAREQFSVGELIGKEDLSRGDLVFFRTYAKFPSHVGIYLGNNLFIHASSVVRKVTIDSLEQPYYVKRFLGGRRLIEGEGEQTRLAADGAQ